MKRPHENLIKAVEKCLDDIFIEGFYADKAVQFNFKRNRKWGSRDRKFIAEAVYEIVRWWRYLHFLLDSEEERIDSRLVFYLWFFLEKGEDLGLDPSLKERALKRKESDLSPAIRQSYPDWLYDLALNEIGEDWHSLAQALNKRAELFLRVNTLKTSRNEVISLFENEKVEALPVRDNEEGLVVPSRKNIFQSDIYKKGFIEVQDIASQMVAPQLKVKSGMRIIDACAGAGGKSLHIAAMMKNKGKIIALDVETNKLEALKVRAKRGGVDIIETRPIEGTKTIKRLEKKADSLLLDVPCSGIGVIRRSPDSKWKLTKKRIDELKKIQSEILQNYSSMLKTGGRMVYSTCSLLPSENEDQVTNFLEKNKNFQLLSEKTLRPDQEGYDGFYIAVIERKI